MKINDQNDLMKLIQNNNLDEIKKSFRENKINLEQFKNFKETLFYLIKENKYFNIIKYFIELQQLKELYQSINNTDLLYYAIECNNFKVVKLLLRKGVRIDNKNNNIFKYLIEKESFNLEKMNFILNIIKDASLSTPNVLNRLLENKNWEMFKQLLEYKYYDVNFIIDIIILSKKSITLSNKELKNYIYYNNKAIIKINDPIDDVIEYWCTLKNNKKILFKSIKIKSYLSIECVRNLNYCLYIYKILLKYASDNDIVLNLNNQYSKYYEFPLSAITRSGNIELLKIFIEYANKNNIILNLNNNFNKKESPIFIAVHMGNVEIIKVLIEYSKQNNILIDLNIFLYNDIYNMLIGCISCNIEKSKNIEILNLLIEYAVQFSIKIKYTKYNLKYNEKINNIINNNKNIFELINEK